MPPSNEAHPQMNADNAARKETTTAMKHIGSRTSGDVSESSGYWERGRLAEMARSATLVSQN